MLRKWKVYLRRFMKAITNKTDDNYQVDFEGGELILIDKVFRKTSFDIVYKVKKAVKVNKVGHAGTLDPRATGLVLVCTGKKTKKIPEIQTLDKTYEGVFSIGKSTASYDLETEFCSESDFSYVTEQLIFSVRDQFMGPIKQMPPMYSALKHNGKALYEFARKGVDLKRDAREVNILEFDITDISLPDISFRIKCTKGTYVRVIANDFGIALGCGAHLKQLRRVSIGTFHVDDAFTIDEFRQKFTVSEPQFSLC